MQPDDVDQGTAGSSVEVNGSPAIDCAPEPGQQLLTKSVLGIVITFGFSALVLGAFVRLIDGGGSWWMTGHNLESGEWYEAVRNTVAAVALSVAGGAAYLAYRRQRTADLTQRTAAEAKEIAARAQQTAANAYALTHQQHKLAVERQQGDEIRQLRARFSQAAEHLAHPSPAVRMAGVYAMAALADDWASRGFTSEVQVCIDVLCGYLRLPYDPEHGADHQRKVVVTHVGTDGQKAQEKHFEFRHNDRQVRQTIVRVIASHLRLELEDERSWSNYAFDFRYSHFEDVDFGQAVFNGRDVLFDCATFSGERTSFYESLVSGERTSFRGATFNAKETDFDKTTFNAKETDFSQATFNGMQTDFDATTFNGTYSDFSQATFNNAEETHFGATFNAEETNFGGATFNAERTHFGAIFNGEWVSLGGATFNGKRVSLRGTFNAEQTKFDGATFNAEE
ncbi:pentapeptide repeat-containing protein, partial [[Mycobacterium] crassicus]|nr:hypothetical protein [Mycolicibacter sp. MYC098]